MARRANGEGSISKRRDGRYQARITLRDGRRKTIYARTRAEVAAKMTTALKAQQDGLPMPSDQLNTGRFLTEWLRTHRTAIRPRTAETYEGLLNRHVIPHIGRHRLTRLEPRHIQRLYADLLENLSPATVHQVHAIIRKALSDAVQWGHLVRNPADVVTRPRVRRAAINPLTKAEARRLLQQVDGDPFEALYVLAISTGMRRGELLALKWDRVNLEMGILQVVETLHLTRDGFRFAEPKSERSRRRIQLPQYAIAALRQHRAAQAERRLALGGAWTDLDLVFPNGIGRPVNARNLLRRSFKPALQAADLPDIRFHDLRHTAATLLLTQSVHPKVVSEMLGHASVSLTLDTYSHVLPDNQAQAAIAMDALFG